MASGSTRKVPAKSSAMVMSVHFTKGDSSAPRWDFAEAAGRDLATEDTAEWIEREWIVD